MSFMCWFQMQWMINFCLKVLYLELRPIITNQADRKVWNFCASENWSTPKLTSVYSLIISMLNGYTEIKWDWYHLWENMRKSLRDRGGAWRDLLTNLFSIMDGISVCFSINKSLDFVFCKPAILVWNVCIAIPILTRRLASPSYLKKK